MDFEKLLIELVKKNSGINYPTLLDSFHRHVGTEFRRRFKRFYNEDQKEAFRKLNDDFMEFSENKFDEFVELKGRYYNMKLYDLPTNISLGRTFLEQPSYNQALGWALDELGKKICLTNPSVSYLPPGKRMYVFHIQTDDLDFVAKLLQSSEERKVAKLASDIGAGPDLYATTPNWLAEKYVDEIWLERSRTTSSQAAKILADLFSRLHSAQIFYRDSVEEHVIVSPNGGYKLVDFGVSVINEYFPKDLRTCRKYLKKEGFADGVNYFNKEYKQNRKRLNSNHLNAINVQAS